MLLPLVKPLIATTGSTTACAAAAAVTAFLPDRYPTAGVALLRTYAKKAT